MRRGTLFWGAVLILLGGLLLLNNLGILRVDVWRIFWPVVLILLGLATLLGSVMRRPAAEGRPVMIPLEGASSARLRIRYGAGRLRLGAGAGPGELVSGTFAEGVDHHSRRVGDVLEVEVRVPEDSFPDVLLPWAWGPASRDWTMGLTPDVPLSIEMETGANEARLDLTDLRVTDLRLKTGASSTDLTLPARAGHTRVRVEAGASALNVRVPTGVEARLRFRGGLSSVDADPTRFTRTGDVYQSAGYDTAENRAEIDVEMGAGSVSLR